MDHEVQSIVMSRFNDFNNNIDSTLIDEKKLGLYLLYLKENFSPRITPEAEEIISRFSSLLLLSAGLTENQDKGFTISPRKIDAIIRIAKSYSKLRQSNEVNFDDANDAVNYFKRMYSSFGFMFVDHEMSTEWSKLDTVFSYCYKCKTKEDVKSYKNKPICKKCFSVV